MSYDNQDGRTTPGQREQRARQQQSDRRMNGVVKALGAIHRSKSFVESIKASVKTEGPRSILFDYLQLNRDYARQIVTLGARAHEEMTAWIKPSEISQSIFAALVVLERKTDDTWQGELVLRNDGYETVHVRTCERVSMPDGSSLVAAWPAAPDGATLAIGEEFKVILHVIEEPGIGYEQNRLGNLGIQASTARDSATELEQVECTLLFQGDSRCDEI